MPGKEQKNCKKNCKEDNAIDLEAKKVESNTLKHKQWFKSLM